jgi:hypothetical protein
MVSLVKEHLFASCLETHLLRPFSTLFCMTFQSLCGFIPRDTFWMVTLAAKALSLPLECMGLSVKLGCHFWITSSSVDLERIGILGIP